MRLPGLLAATLALAMAACKDDSSPAVGQSLSVALLTQENVEAGSATVSNSETTLRIEINTSEGWTLEKTRVAVGTSLARIPQTKKGEPITGLFPLQSKPNHKSTTTKSFSLPLSAEPGTILYFAVQADVWKKPQHGNKDDDKDDKDDDDCGMESAWGAGTSFPKGKGTMYFTYVVQANLPPELLGMYRTHSQKSWGDSPAADKAAGYMTANFAAAFPTGLTIGTSTGFRARFTNSQAITNFLPQAGAPAPLNGIFTDPVVMGNALAGETLALALNVGFDAHDLNFAPGIQPLGELMVADPSSPVFGRSVQEVLGLANQVLAGQGDLTGLLPKDILDSVMRINLNFENGTVDLDYLGLP